MAYILLTFFCFFYASILNVRGVKHEFLIGYLPIFILLVLFYGLQFEVGTDYHSYLSMASGEKDLGWIENNNEFLFVFLNDLAIYTGWPQSIFFFSSIIQIVFLALISFEIKRMRLSFNWFILLYFVFLIAFFNGFNGIRQYIAVYAVVYSILFLLNGAYAKFIVIVVIASFFHSSALFVLPLLLILNACHYKWNIFFVAGAAAVFLAFSLTSLNQFVVLVSEILGYSSYADSSYADRIALSGVVTKLPKIFVVFLCVYLLDRKYQDLVNLYRPFINMAYISTFILIASFSSGVVWRFYQYFDFFTIFPVLILLSYNKSTALTLPMLAVLIFIFSLKVTLFARGEYLYASLFL